MKTIVHPPENKSVDLSEIAGLLIAGGRSSRFGEEKAVSRFRGAPLIEAPARAFSALRCFAVSARPGSGAEQHARARNYPVLHDDARYPSGPLTGLLAGLLWARSSGFGFLATAPCDAPLLPDDLVQRLARAIGDRPAAYASTSTGEHPLCALWRSDMAETIAARLAAGDHPAVRRMLAECGAATVMFEDAGAFANANTKTELAALERRT